MSTSHIPISSVDEKHEHKSTGPLSSATASPYGTALEVLPHHNDHNHAHVHDPALDALNQHTHPHTHHAASSHAATPVYSSVDHASLPIESQTERHSISKELRPPVHDLEKSGSRSSHDGHGNSPNVALGEGKSKLSLFYAKYRIFFHAAIWLFFTAWWIAGLVINEQVLKPRGDKLNWVVPFLIWLCATIRVVTLYIPAGIFMKPVYFIWKNSAVRFQSLIPVKLQLPLGAALVVAVFIVGTFATESSESNTYDNRAVALFGLLVFIGAFWATSKDRSAIKWRTVLVGMLIQFIIALIVLRWSVGYNIFDFISGLARALLGYAGKGTAFLTSAETAKLLWFLITVLPAIIFFVALVQLLFYWGLIQWFIGKFAVFFFWAMEVSGGEAVVAAASPFIGQGESAMLIRPFIIHLTQAEIHQIMTSGFATIAGSVLVAYIGMGLNPQALISSCVMSIPASLAISKLRFPETEESLTAGRVVIPDDEDHQHANALHAFAEGAWLGLKIAGMITATLLCILALLGLVNGLLHWWGTYLTIKNLSVEMIFGYICYPIAFLLGVPRNGDLYKVSKLIGTKLIANEFVAYDMLQKGQEYADISPRSRLIATYALCGFANIGSLGTQIGVLSQLAPSRAGDVSRVALSALISGAISTLTSASIAGLLVTDDIMEFVRPAIVNATELATS